MVAGSDVLKVNDAVVALVAPPASDIVTTGGSLVDTIDAVYKAGGVPVCVSAIADRTGGKVTFGDMGKLQLGGKAAATDDLPWPEMGFALVAAFY